MEDIGINPLYDGEELDPRLKVEVWTPSPYLPAGGHYFEGMHYDERGLVLCYSNGDNLQAKTYDMQIVFPSGFQNVRVAQLGIFQDTKLLELEGIAGLKRNSVRFYAFRCKYTNYFNWCIKQSLDEKFLEREGYHYVIGAEEMLIDVFHINPPKVFFNGYGMHLSDEALRSYPSYDVLYNYEPPGEYGYEYE